MAVSGVKHGALHRHGQIQGVSRAGVAAVHVPALVEGGQRGDRLQLRRGGDGPHKRLPREVHLRVAVAEEAAVRLPVVDPDLLLQRRVQQLCGTRSHQTAEFLDIAADGPVPVGLDIQNIHRQRVSRLRALDVEGAGLGIQVPGHVIAGHAVLAVDLPFAEVLGMDQDLLVLGHPDNGLQIFAEHIGKAAVLSDFNHIGFLLITPSNIVSGSPRSGHPRRSDPPQCSLCP
ncbi:hypothetical protein SDC9_165841 [bioreactor metagenome]|uniref:Uncharacterized protein n=1 Tax=bioreactor metagenome TaxID=1076179 RepID=A0A645FVD4_9ZZZZ